MTEKAIEGKGCGPGDMVSTLAFVTGEPRNTTITVVEPSSSSHGFDSNPPKSKA